MSNWKYILSTVVVAGLMAGTASAALYSEDFETVGLNGSGAGDLILGDYNARLLGGSLFGGGGVEDASNQPNEDGNPDRWLFFQTGNGGNDATIAIDTGVVAVSGTTYEIQFDTAERLNGTTTFTETLTASLYASTDTLAAFDPNTATLIGSTVAINGTDISGDIFVNTFSATAGTVSGNLFLVFDAQSDAGSFQQALVDDIIITPEPASLALVGLGGLLMIRRSRR